MTGDYDVYQDPEQAATAPDDGGIWQVSVEYANGGQAKPPTIVEISREQYGSRQEALEAAKGAAFDFRPPDPLSPRERLVYREDGGYLTVVHGAMSTFHFRTRAVEFLGKGQV